MKSDSSNPFIHKPSTSLEACLLRYKYDLALYAVLEFFPMARYAGFIQTRTEVSRVECSNEIGTPRRGYTHAVADPGMGRKTSQARRYLSRDRRRDNS